MSMIRVAINGFGRIGRAAAKIILEHDDLELVAINDVGDHHLAAHLLKYDSFYGTYEHDVVALEDALHIDNKVITFVSNRNPLELPWADLDIDVVLECTGAFRTTELAQQHLTAGAKKVIISAPAKDDLPTYVLGVNEQEYHGEPIISNASCTTNCLAPLTKVIDDAFGIEESLMTTVHSYTASQNLLDGTNKDLRRARSAGLSMVPTSTGAATATTKVIPALQGHMNGLSVRVPTPDVSLLDVTFLLRQEVTPQQAHQAMQSAEQTTLQGILHVSDKPLVSVDYRKSPYSCIIDSLLTQKQGRLLKVLAWYDNEWGYASRLVEMAAFISQR